MEEEKFVVFDRFVDSSYVYQGMARCLKLEEVIAVNEIATKNFFPNKTIILDLNPEVGLKRIKEKRQDEINRLDMEELAFHQRVRKGYQKLGEMYPERIIFVDAEQEEEKVFENVLEIIKSL